MLLYNFPYIYFDYQEEDGDGGSGDSTGGVRKYMERYKELTSSLNDVLMDVLQGCDASTMLDPDPLIERLKEISGDVARYLSYNS